MHKRIQYNVLTFAKDHTAQSIKSYPTERQLRWDEHVWHFRHTDSSTRVPSAESARWPGWYANGTEHMIVVKIVILFIGRNVRIWNTPWCLLLRTASSCARYAGPCSQQNTKPYQFRAHVVRLRTASLIVHIFRLAILAFRKNWRIITRYAIRVATPAEQRTGAHVPALFRFNRKIIMSSQPRRRRWAVTKNIAKRHPLLPPPPHISLPTIRPGIRIHTLCSLRRKNTAQREAATNWTPLHRATVYGESEQFGRFLRRL